MSLRGSNIWPSVARAGNTLPCRHCGRPAGTARGDVIHVDARPRGTSWAEHASCRRQKPSRDYLAPWRLP
jgi:hypothetical protein